MSLIKKDENSALQVLQAHKNAENFQEMEAYVSDLPTEVLADLQLVSARIQQYGIDDLPYHLKLIEEYLGFSAGDYPYLREAAEEKFPGGIKGLLAYLRRFNHTNDDEEIKSYIREELVFKMTSSKNLETYYTIGKSIYDQFGYGAALVYFSGVWRCQAIKNLIEDQPQKFAELFEEACQLASRFKAFAPTIIKFYLQCYAHPRFDELKSAIEKVIYSGRTYIQNQSTDERKSSDLSGMCYEFELLIGIDDGEPELTSPEKDKERYGYIRDNEKDTEHYCEVVFEGHGDPVVMSHNFCEMARRGYLKPVLAKELFFDKDELYKKIGEIGERYTCETFDLRSVDRVDSELKKAVEYVARASALWLPLTNLRGFTYSQTHPPYGALETAIVTGDTEEVERKIKEIRNFQPPKHDLDAVRERVLEAKALIAELKEWQKDESKKTWANFEYVINDLQGLIPLAEFQLMLSGRQAPAILSAKKAVKVSNRNENTQSVIAGISFLVSLGVVSEYDLRSIGITGGAHGQLANGITTLPKDIAQSVTNGGPKQLLNISPITDSQAYWQQLQENIGIVTPRVEAFIRRERIASIGLMPVGAKVHVTRPIDESIVAFLNQIFALHSTAFQLIHAGKSLILPPLPSAAEQSLMLLVLQKLGVFDLDGPELQTAMGGRCNRENAALIGPAMMLGTERGMRYRKGAFQTTHDQDTGARMMVFDKGVKKEGLPFDIAAAKGRTDKLGCGIASDIANFQLLKTLATHREHHARFAPLFDRFRGQMGQVLSAHGLYDIVHSSAWIYQHAQAGDTLENHEEMVGSVAEAWFRGREAGPQRHFGAVGDVRKLLMEARSNVQAQSDRIRIEEPEEVEKLLNY